MLEYYEVNDYGLKTLSEKIEKLNKKAKKIGVSELSIEVSNPYIIEDPETKAYEYAPKKYIRVYDVFVHGELPKYNDWIFVARIEGYPNGNNVIHTSPKVFENFDIEEDDIEKYRTKKSFCDHCKTRRYRKYTYIIYNTNTKDLFQVGSTCIKDFLGHDVPSFAWFSKALSELDEDDLGSELRNGPSATFYPLHDYLSLGVEVIKNTGFVSNKKADEEYLTPTSHFVDTLYNDYKARREFGYESVSDESEREASKIIEWGKGLKNRDGLNNYMNNLSVIFDSEVVSPSSTDLLISSFVAYKRDMGIEEEEKKGHNPKNSEYFGEPRVRYELGLTLNKVLEFEGKFGVVYFHVFYDDDDNQFVWFGSKRLDLLIETEWGSSKATIQKNNKNYYEKVIDEGEKVRVKATVKRHQEYNGIKQTIITRVTAINIIEQD
ncbi:MAG: hypothetical protein ACOCP4_00700 [Candidatus Woesearchaeota archaeon]